MPARVLLLASGLIIWFVLFGLGFGEDRPPPAIDMQEATRIVLAQFPNARIKEIELDTEDGKLVYEVELVTADGQKKEMHINATTGKIERIKND
jgi:uncharacterized membrane protein YkoI